MKKDNCLLKKVMPERYRIQIDLKETNSVILGMEDSYQENDTTELKVIGRKTGSEKR